MLMQLLQFRFTGDGGQALEEWERLERQYEAQSSDTIKAAILSHNPQDPEWRKLFGLNATRLQGYDALRVEWKAVHQACRQWGMADGNEATPMEIDALTKGKDKDKSKNKDKPKERAPVKSSMKCFFCKEKADCPKFTTWLAQKEDSGTRAERERHRGSRLNLCLGSEPEHT